MRIADFVVDWYTTVLDPDEIITSVLVPPAPKSSVGVFEKLERTGGDYAIASVACILAVDRGVCTEARSRCWSVRGAADPTRGG